MRRISMRSIPEPVITLSFTLQHDAFDACTGAGWGMCHRQWRRTCQSRVQLPPRGCRLKEPWDLYQRRSGCVRVCDSLDAVSCATDKSTVRTLMPNQTGPQMCSVPWAMQMKAVSTVEP